MSDTSAATHLTAPAYTVAEAARLADLSPGRVRRWMRGYSFPVGDRLRRQRPVVRVGHDGHASHLASFLDLVDLLFVKRFLSTGVSLQRIRGALDEARSILGTDNFAREVFFFDGRNLFLQMQDQGNAILQLMTDGQWTIAPVIRELAEQIEFGGEAGSGPVGGFAQKWHPLGRDRPIVIDPRVAFGAPSLVGRGVKTANVYDLFVAENERVDAVCSWWDLSPVEVGRGALRAGTRGVRFFVDNNLSPGLARGMRAFGEDVIHLTEEFPADTEDAEWLARVGSRGWFVITRDDRIRYRSAELAAIRKSSVGAFFLGGKNRSRCDLIQQLVRNWPIIKEHAAKTRTPFAFRIPPAGSKLKSLPLD